MAYINPSITDKGLKTINSKVREPSELANLPRFLTSEGIQVQKPYTNYILKMFERLNLAFSYVNMTPDYNYRPDYVAYDYYGTTNLYWFVLYTNKVRSLLDFTVSTIKKIKIYRPDDVKLVLEAIQREK